jgi:excinuclease ABC subunit C
MYPKASLRTIVNSMPSEPGIYQFFDKKGIIIYIGKAKDLKKRVSSYFKGKLENNKTTVLVKQIYDLRYIVVKTEQDALLLENTLIKKHQPRYNVLLKDDKTFPWICIKNEAFSRVYYTRKVIKDGSIYYGPFTSMFLVNTLIDLFRHTYKLRTCNLNLSTDNVSRGKYKVCLQYHIGNCLGPCEKLQTFSDYELRIDEIKHILKGNIGQVIIGLKEEMKLQSDLLNFETAQCIKDRLEILQKYQAKSIVVSPSIRNIDVYSFQKEESLFYVNFLKVVDGSIIQSFTIEVRERVEESDEDLLLIGITEIRSKIYSNAKEIILPLKPTYKLKGVKFTVPLKGEKKSLLDLSERNLKYFVLEKIKSNFNSKAEFSFERVLNSVKQDLYLDEVPKHIECFDNSNLQGTNPVASCVVFKNGKPSKRDYRHFNIKTVTGPDDFLSMKEIVFRRYQRTIDENQELPNLIIVDGGKGQLSAAMSVLEELSIIGKVAIIGIAKRLEEIYFPNDSIPLYINKNSETLKLIQQMRDEAHRFAIKHHREKRSKQMILSELDHIKGIGSKTKELLFKEFKTIEGIRAASIEDIKRVAGNKKGSIVNDYFTSRIF